MHKLSKAKHHCHSRSRGGTGSQAQALYKERKAGKDYDGKRKGQRPEHEGKKFPRISSATINQTEILAAVKVGRRIEPELSQKGLRDQKEKQAGNEL